VGLESFEPDEAVRPDDAPLLRVELSPPLRVEDPPLGAADPVLLAPPRDRVDCSLARWGAEYPDHVAGVELDVEEGDDQPELMPPTSPLDPLLLLLPPLLPALDPPPSPPRGAAEPPPPSPRGTADPVVFPFDVRSCADATPESGNPATANVRA
jgi:hypothetical protein